MVEPYSEGLARIAGLLDEALSIADGIDHPLLAALIAQAADAVRTSEAS